MEKAKKTKASTLQFANTPVIRHPYSRINLILVEIKFLSKKNFLQGNSIQRTLSTNNTSLLDEIYGHDTPFFSK